MSEILLHCRTFFDEHDWRRTATLQNYSLLLMATTITMAFQSVSTN